MCMCVCASERSERTYGCCSDQGLKGGVGRKVQGDITD